MYSVIHVLDCTIIPLILTRYRSTPARSLLRNLPSYFSIPSHEQSMFTNFEKPGSEKEREIPSIWKCLPTSCVLLHELRLTCRSVSAVCTFSYLTGPFTWCVNRKGVYMSKNKTCSGPIGMSSFMKSILSLRDVDGYGCATPGRPGVPSVEPRLSPFSFRVTIVWRDPGKHHI